MTGITILDSAEVEAFKRGISDYIEVGNIDEDERIKWTYHYYKKGYEYGSTLYKDEDIQHMRGE